MADNRLEIAKNLLKRGKVNEARRILEGFLKENRAHTYGWWLYAETWPSVEDKRKVWGYCLRLNPDSTEAKQALAALSVETNASLRNGQGKDAHTPRKKTKFSFTAFATFAGVFIVSVIAVTIMIVVSQPAAAIDPAPYRFAQPVEYYLYVPTNYSSDREWPLFVGIHGSGASGLDCWNLWQTYAEKEGYILLCPSIPGDVRGFRVDIGENTVWKAVGEVQKKYRVSQRMFFAGVSGGAYFIQFFAAHYPNHVSGLAILSTGYVGPQMQARVPVLVAIGGADNPTSIQANEELVSYLTQNGFDVQYKVFPLVGHRVSNEGRKLTIELFRKTIGK